MAGNITEAAIQVSFQASLSNSGRSPSALQTSRLTLDQQPDMLQRWSDPSQQWSLLLYSVASADIQESNGCPGMPQQLGACSHRLCLLQRCVSGVGGRGWLVNTAEKWVYWASFQILCSNHTWGQVWAPRSESWQSQMKQLLQSEEPAIWGPFKFLVINKK